VAGQTLTVLVEEGHRVTKGQPLLQLDPIDYQRQVTRAQQEVERAAAALELAQLTLERRQRGFAERGVTQADVETAQNDVKQKRIACASAREALATARDQLVYTRIVSPLNGTVTQRNIQPGETVVPGVAATFDDRSLLTVSDLSVLIAKAELNQIDVAKVRLGQPATITLDALPGRSFSAKVTKIAPAAILPKGKDVEVFPIEATLEREGTEVIKPGMTADVKIHIELKQNVLKLPIEAVVKEKGKAYVMKVLDEVQQGQKARTLRVEVQPGARNDRDQEILSGLAEGDRVLIKPASADANEWK
jgi:RND family efflux transporter MFP subunit